MSSLRDTKEGMILPVKVIPRARKEEIVGWQEGRLKIKVCAPPDKGEANRAVIRLLSKTYTLPQYKIVLIKGETGRQKEFLLIGYTVLKFERFLSKMQP